MSFLPVSSCGWLLPADHELNRALGVQEDLLQPDRIAQHESESLVGRDPPGEPNGEHVRVEDVPHPPELRRAGATLQPARPHPSACLGDELLPQRPLGSPDLVAGDVGDTTPGVMPIHIGRAQVLGRKLVYLTVDPGPGMDTVGNTGDRHFRVVEPGPEAFEHVTAHHAVQLGDPVGALGQAQAHDCHVEHAGLASGIVLGTEREQLLEGHARDGTVPHDTVPHDTVPAEVEPDLVGAETVDTGRDGGVRGEDGACPHRFQCLLERQGVRRVRAGQLPDPFDAQEAGVTLVGVKDIRGRGACQP